MKNISIGDFIKKLCNDRLFFLEDERIKFKKQYLDNYGLGFYTNGYTTNIILMLKTFKDEGESISEGKVESIFIELQEMFFKGHDMEYMRLKKKEEPYAYLTAPIDELIYSLLIKNVKEKYNAFSFRKENPDYDNNMKSLDRLIFIYEELNPLLYLLYCNDFHPCCSLEDLFPYTYNDLIKILNESGMTIGDFLHSLIDFKCNTMRDILKEIENGRLQKQYLLKVEDLRKEKHNEINTFTHIHLPITYFLDNTFNDFMEDELNRSSITKNPESKNVRKIILK